MREALLVGLVTSATLLTSPLLGTQPEKKSLEPEAVGIGASLSPTSGPQFLGADRAGRVSVFLAGKLSLLHQRPNGSFSAPYKLEATTAPAHRTLGAARNPSGERWLVQTADGLRLFAEGKEKLLPQPGWHPWSVGFVGDTPVAAVIPLLLEPGGRGRSKQSAVPWLLVFDGAKWVPFVEHRDLTLGEAIGADLNGFIAQHAVVLAGSRDGKLWAGNQYSYRVRRYSAAGKRLFELTVDGGTVADKKGETASKFPTGGRAFTARSILRGLTEGRDGLLYMIVSPSEDGKLVLDRFDPIRGKLDRVPLPRATAPGLFSVAAGKDGLYFASVDPKAGRWRVGWEALEGASWTPVKNVEIRASGR